MLRTIILLIASNLFMTFAWYYHLKQDGWPIWMLAGLLFHFLFLDDI